jgi:amino acid transporter
MAVVSNEPAADQVGEHGEFARQLTWRDGFALGLIVPIAIFATVAPAIAAIGALSVAALFGIACVVGILQNYLFAEMASMFPDKPGGIALYAHEAWRKYFSPIGALAAFGYWAGWAFALSIFALTFGSLIQGQFFADSTWTISTGPTDVGLAHVIALVALLFIGGLNVTGIRPAVWLNKILGLIAVALIVLLVIGPFVTGAWDAGELTWGLGAEGQDWGGLRVALAFLFIFGWTAYATELCATFSPEYRDQPRDTSLALRTAGAFTLGLAVLIPLGLGGTVGDAAIAANPGETYAAAFEAVVGTSGAAVVTLVLAASFLLIMNSATADAGRALYGIAKDDMTVKQLKHLNRHNSPSRAILVTVVVNVALLLFVGNVLGIIFASNVGYMTMIFFALTGFLLLRRDRPNWPRPIRLGAKAWIPLAIVLAAYNLVLVIVGAFSPAEAGYGGTTEQLVGFGVLLVSVLLFVYRRVVQDRGPLRLRESAPSEPPAPLSRTAAPVGNGASEPGVVAPGSTGSPTHV